MENCSALGNLPLFLMILIAFLRLFSQRSVNFSLETLRSLLLFVFWLIEKLLLIVLVIKYNCLSRNSIDDLFKLSLMSGSIGKHLTIRQQNFINCVLHGSLIFFL